MKKKVKKIKFRIPIAPKSDIAHKDKSKYDRKSKHKRSQDDRQD